MSTRNVRRVSRFVSQQVWALTESTLDVVVEVLRMRAAGIVLSKEEVQARIGAGPAPSAAVRGAVAVLPLQGVIAPKMNAMTEISGGTSLDMWMKQFREYRDDPNVSAIVADIDSPGGSVFGVPEAYAEIYKSRGAKPLVASVNPECGSAALWIASAFGEIVCTPSGEIGSLGCFCVHEDWSKANEMMGVKSTYISYGDYKTEGNPDEPLSDETLAYLQSRVNAIGEDFVKAVSKSRGVSVANVKKNFGQGRMLPSEMALSVGLIDKIGTLEETVGRYAGGGRRRSVAAENDGAAWTVTTDGDISVTAASVADSSTVVFTQEGTTETTTDSPTATAEPADTSDAEAARAEQAQKDVDLLATTLAILE